MTDELLAALAADVLRKLFGHRWDECAADDQDEVAARLTTVADAIRAVVLDRDIEWWEKLALVDSVAPTPEAVKAWILTESAYKPDASDKAEPVNLEPDPAVAKAEAERDRLAAAVAELRAALAPFAEVGKVANDPMNFGALPGDAEMRVRFNASHLWGWRITVGDCRRAAEAMAKTEPGGGVP